MNIKNLERYLRVNFLGPVPCLMKKEFTAAISQRLRNTELDHTATAIGQIIIELNASEVLVCLTMASSQFIGFVCGFTKSVFVYLLPPYTTLVPNIKKHHSKP